MHTETDCKEDKVYQVHKVITSSVPVIKTELLFVPGSFDTRRPFTPVQMPKLSLNFSLFTPKNSGVGVSLYWGSFLWLQGTADAALGTFDVRESQSEWE